MRITTQLYPNTTALFWAVSRQSGRPIGLVELANRFWHILDHSDRRADTVLNGDLLNGAFVYTAPTPSRTWTGACSTTEDFLLAWPDMASLSIFTWRGYCSTLKALSS